MTGQFDIAASKIWRTRNKLKTIAMFLRFVTTRIHKDSHKPQGVFAASYSLLESGDLSAEEWKRVREILNWFNAHLPTPPKTFSKRRAIFWFKSTAEESIGQIWELVYLLRQQGFHLEVQKCRHLANICYEDQFQVAAYPSKLDQRITTQ
jgi:hypothetical protein